MINIIRQVSRPKIYAKSLPEWFFALSYVTTTSHLSDGEDSELQKANTYVKKPT